MGLIPSAVRSSTLSNRYLSPLQSRNRRGLEDADLRIRLSDPVVQQL